MRAGACHAGTGPTNANAHVAGPRNDPARHGSTAPRVTGTTGEEHTAMSTDPPEYEPPEPDTLTDVMRACVSALLRQHTPERCAKDNHIVELGACMSLWSEIMYAADAYACADYDYLVAQLRDSLMARQA